MGWAVIVGVVLLLRRQGGTYYAYESYKFYKSYKEGGREEASRRCVWLLLGWYYCCADERTDMRLMNHISFISLIRKEVGEEA